MEMVTKMKGFYKMSLSIFFNRASGGSLTVDLNSSIFDIAFGYTK